MAKIRPHFKNDRQVLADLVPLEMPFCIQCEVSQVCNIKCSYCMQSFINRKDKQLMTFAIFAMLCARLYEYYKIGKKFKQFNFAGWGEPLVNPKLDIMIKHLHDYNYVENIAIVTNGLLLTPDLSLRLIDAGVNQIRISLQGMTEEKYEEISGKRIDFQKLVNNVRILYEHRKDCQIYIKIADIALEDEKEECFFYDTFDPVCDQMYVETIRPMFHQNKQDDKLLSRYGDPHPPIIVCPQPFYMLNITARGDITPCCSYYDPINLGNLTNTSLRQVWEGDEMRKLQKMLLTGNRNRSSFYPACSGCLMPDATIGPGDELDSKREEIMKRYGSD